MLPILDVAAPWGGFKTSGWGREFSHQALDAFTETKSVFIGLG
jgi:acyl-CoA reductase-like NAD-dependent aldehyde dehydrogenase